MVSAVATQKRTQALICCAMAASLNYVSCHRGGFPSPAESCRLEAPRGGEFRGGEVRSIMSTPEDPLPESDLGGPVALKSPPLEREDRRRPIGAAESPPLLVRMGASRNCIACNMRQQHATPFLPHFQLHSALWSAGCCINRLLLFGRLQASCRPPT